MTDNLVTLADERDRKAKEKAEKKMKEKEAFRKWFVPMSALVVANIIFFSLDLRAFQAMYILTSSYLLSTLTVLISGGLAMYWFDVLYPHSKRHNNDVQQNISMIFTVLAISLSGVLAFADYVVGTGESFSGGWSTALWASIIVLTIAQGVAIAWWWSIDNHIAAEAKIQEAHAEAADTEDEMSILRTKLNGLRGVLTELDKLNKDFTPAAVSNVANILGIALPSDMQIKPQQGQRPPQNMPMTAHAADVDGVTLPTSAERQSDKTPRQNGQQL